MTDVKAHQADRFLRQLPREIVAVLFYGTDPGLVSERGERLATAYAAGQSPPGEVLRLTEDDVSASPDRLAVELRTLPMFGGRNAVRFLAPSLTKPDLVTDLLDGGPLEALLIVEAGNLKPDSKLRAAFAKAATAAAVACYADEPDALRNLAREVMTAGRIRFAPGAESHLLGLLGADRALSRGELEKLALYVGENGEATLEDIDAIVGDASEQATDRIVLAAFAGEAATALKELDKAVAAGDSPQMIVLAVIRHLTRLQQIRAGLDAGKPGDQVMRSLRPPVHFKQQDAVAGQARRWTLARLSEALRLADRAAFQARVTSRLERELTERLLIDLTLLTKRPA